ncbi:unnamed protein product [Cyclocybe aegerita]|uniref:HAT C-terminal dimerisation domain-containing protein n=1 Tax=Cyclocybe aegerita TaxID=1973307 RepID=A0A8S0X319_CYCAE|nr:unnamed protein product [Cyclocybe aegerita]
MIPDDSPQLEDFDLLHFWQANQTRFPLFWKLALDVLPAQASSVPCERIFSSSKEMDTSRRSNLSPLHMEQLQIMKFSYRNDRLNFTDHLLSSEEELSVLDMSVEVVESLLAGGKIEELNQYVNESWEGWGWSNDNGNKQETASWIASLQ